MKKQLYSLLLLLSAAWMFTACSSDDDNNTVIDWETYSHTIFAAAAGNWGQNNGAVGAIDADNSGKYSYTDIYKTANGKLVGDAQDVLPLYHKLYVASTTSSKIEDVYVSAYNGYIYKLTNGDLTDSVKVGGYPEAMSVANGKLYVNMSDYKYNNSGKSISVIDLKSFKKTKELDCELNPYNQSVAVGNKVYFVSTYHADQDGALQCIDATTDKITNTGVKASAIAYDKVGNSIVALLTGYDANWTLSVKSFFRYSLADGKTTQLDHSAFTSPQQVNVDPVSGRIFVIDNPSYTAPSSLYIYDNNGKLLQGGLQMSYSVQNIRFFAEAYK